MRLNRFIGDFDLSKDFLSITDKNQVSQIANVLRMKIGDILLVVGSDGEAEAKITNLKDGMVNLKIINHVSREGESRAKINLYLSVLKKDNFELVVQKATECGVSSITPVISERTVKLGLNFERLEKIAKEAAEQSGRTDIPEIQHQSDLKSAIASLSGQSLNIIFDPTGAPVSSIENKKETVNLFIGPEGGWSPEEIKLFASYDSFKIINLGGNILRAETAAIVTTYLFSQIYV